MSSMVRVVRSSNVRSASNLSLATERASSVGTLVKSDTTSKEKRTSFGCIVSDWMNLMKSTLFGMADCKLLVNGCSNLYRNLDSWYDGEA